jgi:hypothetical protein
MAMPANLCTVPQLRRALLSAEEVAELLHVPVTWVYERTRSAVLATLCIFAGCEQQVNATAMYRKAASNLRAMYRILA